MAKKKAARPAKKKTGASAKKAKRKASAPARRTAKAAKKGRKAAAAKPRKRQAARTSTRAARPARRSASRKATSARKAKPVRKSAPARKATRKAAPARKTALTRKPMAKPAPAKAPIATAKPAETAVKPVALTSAAPAPSAPTVKAARRPKKKANLDRPRRTVAEIHGVPSSLDMDRAASAVRTGRAEMTQKLQQQTNTSPALTAGDVDADWGAAASSGDEAPGGDNPTPDQDVVDEIGRALGVEYDDDEELQGGDEIAERDRHRWELDPGSSDDFEDR